MLGAAHLNHHYSILFHVIFMYYERLHFHEIFVSKSFNVFLIASKTSEKIVYVEKNDWWKKGNIFFNNYSIVNVPKNFSRHFLQITMTHECHCISIKCFYTLGSLWCMSMQWNIYGLYDCVFSSCWTHEYVSSV